MLSAHPGARVVSKLVKVLELHTSMGVHMTPGCSVKRETALRGWGPGKAPDDSCQGEPSAPVSQSREKGRAASKTASPC